MSAVARQPTLLWSLIGLDGRINREVFWLGNIGCWFAGVAFLMPGFNPDTGVLEFTATTPFVLLAAFWVQVALAVKRLHDRDLTGWLVLVLLVPLVGIVAFFVIGLLPGTQGPNKYGPATNSRGPV